MKYQQADDIFKKIKSANYILITSHINPDMDSIGSTLSAYHCLNQLNKNVEIVLTDEVPNEMEFLPNAGDIKKQEISDVDFNKYDLILVLDAANLQRITRSLEPLSLPSTGTINIDHHATNDNYASINLVEVASSTSEILYNLYKDWNIEITKEIAECLLTGITGDTSGFQFVDNGKTLHIAGDLIDLGASPREISYHTLRNVDIGKLNFWGLCLSRAKISDTSPKYVWAAVNFEEIERGGGREVKEGAESFFNKVKDTDFGVLITEQEKGILSGSFRARSDIDVSLAAMKLGGGGHKGAAGFKLTLGELSFDEGVQKIHDTIMETYEN